MTNKTKDVAIDLGDGMSLSVIIGAVGQKVAASLVVTALKSIRPGLIFEKNRYRERLRERLAEMPFLFRDMNLSARDDYVKLDVLTIPEGYLKPFERARADDGGPLPKFKEYRRALMFGGGGYGKTTLFRYLALRCLEKKPWQKMFGERGLVPIYVPLKLVKTSTDFPVLDGIRDVDPYFQGARGLKRLKRLGNAGKLIILLDGYDEMPYTGGFNHARRELETIFESSTDFARDDGFRVPTSFEASPYWSVYKALRNSRIYLASRREFFEYNPFPIEISVQRWIVRGLDDRRIELVEKIFSKYRAQTKASRGVDLNSELFLQNLIRRGDENLVEMSKSPLFLTVMCYVYVHQLRESGSSNLFSLGGYELSKTCMRLLLEDLDRYKSKSNSPTEREAIQNRRSAYPEEKYEFLKYFSVGLYAESKGFFDETYVNQVATRYFSSCSGSNYAEEIVRGLRSDDPTSNLVKQIILSGLFVLVDKYKDVKYFDLPHRKFRETLAVEYFDNLDKLAQLKDLVSSRSHSELLLVFIEQSARRGAVVDEILKQAVSLHRPSHIDVLLVDALKRLPARQAGDAIVNLLRMLPAEDGVYIAVDVLNYIPRDEGNVRYVMEKFTSALQSGKAHLVSRWAVVAARVNDSLAVDELVRACSFLVDFDVMRAAVYSPVVSGCFRSEIIGHYIKIAAEYGNRRLAIADLFRLFYVGRSDADKRDALVRFQCIIADLHTISGLREDYEVVSAVFMEVSEDNGVAISNARAPHSGWREAGATV